MYVHWYFSNIFLISTKIISSYSRCFERIYIYIYPQSRLWLSYSVRVRRDGHRNRLFITVDGFTSATIAPSVIASRDVFGHHAERRPAADAATSGHCKQREPAGPRRPGGGGAELVRIILPGGGERGNARLPTVRSPCTHTTRLEYVTVWIVFWFSVYFADQFRFRWSRTDGLTGTLRDDQFHGEPLARC